MSEIARAIDAPLNSVITATEAAIEAFIARMPSGMLEPHYTGDRSDTITGFRGVRVFGYTDGAGERNLQVNGPEPLIAALVEKYGDRFDPWGRARGHVVFHLTAPRRSAGCARPDGTAPHAR